MGFVMLSLLCLPIKTTLGEKCPAKMVSKDVSKLKARNKVVPYPDGSRQDKKASLKKHFH